MKGRVLTEVGGLGDEGQESESGEGGFGPRGTSWCGDRDEKNKLSHRLTTKRVKMRER